MQWAWGPWAGEAECVCAVVWLCPRLCSVDMCWLANCGLHKATLVEIRSWSVNWRSLTGGCPMGEAGTLPHPRYCWPWHEHCLLMDWLRSWTRPWGTTVLSIIVPSVPPLTPPSSECHRHHGGNKSLSDTEREKGARAGKRRDEKCPFYDSHNKAGHVIRSKHFSWKRERTGGISKKAELFLSPGRCPWGINRGVWVTFEGKYPRKGKISQSFGKLTPVSDAALWNAPCSTRPPWMESRGISDLLCY